MTSGDRSTAEQHTGTLVLAAVTALLELAERTLPGGVHELVRRQPFVQGYVESVAAWLPEGIAWDASVLWWEQRLAELEGAAVEPLPLTRVPALGGVRDRIALALVALPDEDDRFLQVVRELQGTPVDGMPAGTVVGALERPGERHVARLLDRWGREHLVEPVPGAAQPRRVAGRLWSTVRDDESWAAAVTGAAAAAPDTVTHWTPERRARLRRPLEMLADGRIDTLVVRQVPGAGGAAAVSAVLAAPVLWLTEGELLRGPGLALAAALGALPATALDHGVGEQRDVPRPDWYDGPLVVLTGLSGGVAGRQGDRRADVLLDRCDAGERRRLWGALLPNAAGERLDVLAGSLVLPDGHLRRLAAEASVLAEVEERRVPVLADVRRAAQRLADQLLEVTATRLDNEGLTWADVVTGPRVRTDLELLEQRCRLREELAAGDRGLGGTGVRVLLSGPSGCGKTLAARTLAAVLGRSIYRVDLAAVFDKYVGVTEKILERLLTDAEQLDTVLLLDEGDSLLGSRTDVRSANDRYANLETNFLLQRLETYSGILIVTTNSPERIDSGFARRMDATIAFGRPRSAARRRIWELHLPEGHGVGEGQLAALADRHPLTGGQIRNAVQHARLLSARDGTTVDAAAVEAGVAAERRKAGAMPATGAQDVLPHAVAMDRYVRGMAQAGRRRAPRRPA